jgi:hypothetical protein
MGITKMAGGTFIWKHHPGMVFPGIHRQYFGRTEFHADAAAFTPSGVQDDLAARTFLNRGNCMDGHWR